MANTVDKLAQLEAQNKTLRKALIRLLTAIEDVSTVRGGTWHVFYACPAVFGRECSCNINEAVTQAIEVLEA